MVPRLSIIVPVYNEEKYLERCFDSIPVSDKIQVIVVDDGSTDNSGDICDCYDKFTVCHTENHGVSSARNLGLELAEGEWITFLDSDDRLVDSFTKNIFAGIEKAEKAGVDLVQFNHKRYYSAIDRAVRKYTNKAGLYSVDSIFGLRFWNAVWNKAYKRSFIEELHARFPENLNCGEDEIFNLKILFAMDSFWHDNACTFIRHFDNPNSIMHMHTKEDTQNLIDHLYVLLYEDVDEIHKDVLMSRIEELEGSLNE